MNPSIEWSVNSLWVEGPVSEHGGTLSAQQNPEIKHRAKAAEGQDQHTSAPAPDASESILSELGNPKPSWPQGLNHADSTAASVPNSASRTLDDQISSSTDSSLWEAHCASPDERTSASLHALVDSAHQVGV